MSQAPSLRRLRHSRRARLLVVETPAPRTRRPLGLTAWLALGLALTAGCGLSDADPVPDAAPDAAHVDAHRTDASGSDADTPDADTPDADTPDADTPDADTPDAASPDLGPATDGEPMPELGPLADAGPPPPDVPLGLNDLSVLLPGAGVPPDFSGLPRLDDRGRGGPLLPRAVYDRLPPLAPDRDGAAALYPRLRVVAIRFDGCFKGRNEDPCDTQIRLVAQPLGPQGAVLDAALHLFYPLPEADFRRVVGDLRRLRALAPEATVDGPLAVHPALVAQGLDGAYGRALLDLVFAEAGAERLSRVTFMTREPTRADRWVFGGLEVLDAFAAPPATENIRIAEIDAIRQSVTLNPPTADAYRYIVSPVGTLQGDASPLFTADDAAEAAEPARTGAVNALIRLENPHLVAVDEAQCVTCHLAAFARIETERRYGASASAERFAQPGVDLSLAGTAHLNPRSLRAFGWFEASPAIAPRVIHETADALLQIEARFPAR